MAAADARLYDAAKLEALAGFDEIYQPAYVEDLDLGVRAWLRGWPSVYCAEARVLHEHRATTSRYFSPEDLDRALETNYVQFLARAIGDPETFSRLWQHNVLRLKALEKEAGLSAAAHQPAIPVPAGDMRFLDLVNGEVAVFPGRAASGKPVILVASPYVPFPLSHGAAVRIYNLMRRAAADFDQVLVAFTEESLPVPRELREICTEIVTVRRAGSHALPSRGRPDTVEEFDTPAFHAALRQTIAKWRPGIVQLEFTQMAQYAAGVRPGADDPGRARYHLRSLRPDAGHRKRRLGDPPPAPAVDELRNRRVESGGSRSHHVGAGSRPGRRTRLRFPTASIWTASSRRRSRPIPGGCCSSDPLRIGPT